MRLRIALDRDVAELPSRGPGRLMGREHAAPADTLPEAELVPGFAARVDTLGVTAHDGNRALEQHGLARLRLPRPSPFELAERLGRNLAAVDLDRRSGCHSEALAGMRRMPHAEILIQTVARQPEPNPCKRGLDRDIDHTGLDGHVNQLQSQRARAHRDQAQGLQMNVEAHRLQPAAFTQQGASPHVERHAVRPHLAGVPHQRFAIHQQTELQPICGWHEPRRRVLGVGRIEQAGHVGPGRHDPAGAAGRRTSAPDAEEAVADGEP